MNIKDVKPTDVVACNILSEGNYVGFNCPKYNVLLFGTTITYLQYIGCEVELYTPEAEKEDRSHVYTKDELSKLTKAELNSILADYGGSSSSQDTRATLIDKILNAQK